MHILHLLASPFVGGPERQVLGLASALPAPYRTTFLSFAERGLARPFLDRARSDGHGAIELTTNFPRVDRAVNEVASILRTSGASVLCCSGYKPDLVGWRAARKSGVPVLSVAHGWTGVTWKVRLYERLDAFAMSWMDAVVCVSEAMRARVVAKGVKSGRAVLIRNALDARPYNTPDDGCRGRVLDFFGGFRPTLVVGAAGRLSPEKGFDVFIDAAAILRKDHPGAGFLLFGAGPLEGELRSRVREKGLEGVFVFGGFRTDLERYLPGLDVGVLSSHTEGLPVAVLEAQAAGAPVVATAVGGTPEVVADGVTGFLVPPADPAALAAKISLLLRDDALRATMSRAGRERVKTEFTFAAQADRYRELFSRLTAGGVGGKRL